MILSNVRIEIIACPKCKSKVILLDDGFKCEKCKLFYPIRDGIPVMLLDDAKAVN